MQMDSMDLKMYNSSKVYHIGKHGKIYRSISGLAFRRPQVSLKIWTKKNLHPQEDIGKQVFF